MNIDSIAITDLNTGEVVDIFGKLPDSKFIVKGPKMYSVGLERLLEHFTSAELKNIVAVANSKHVSYYNTLTCKFSLLVGNVDKTYKSRLKRKMLDNKVLGEYNKVLMLNPYIFIPKRDKNIQNCQYLTQRAWKYMFEDMNSGSEEIIKHAELIFGPTAQSRCITVGAGEYAKTIEAPKAV
jgi:hypothetical protein